MERTRPTPKEGNSSSANSNREPVVIRCKSGYCSQEKRSDEIARKQDCISSKKSKVLPAMIGVLKYIDSFCLNIFFHKSKVKIVHI